MPVNVPMSLLPDYRIVFFDEIDDPYKITQLFQLSLGFTAMPHVLKYIREHDGRYTPEFGIFAVTGDGVVAGGHFLMRITSETIRGSLDVGGVNAVGTRPDHSRRGIMTSVMSRTHEYLRERGLEYSILTTSQRLGAMMMYEKMDYVTIASGWTATKYPKGTRIPAPKEIQVRLFSKDDLDAVDNVYNETTKGSYGFIHRPKRFLEAREYSSGPIKWEHLRIAQRGADVTGYAYWDVGPGTCEALEIKALDKASFHGLLAEAEQQNPDAAITTYDPTSPQVSWLKEVGFQAPIETYMRLVIKSLEGKSDAEAIKKLYGVDSGRFRLGFWDGT